MQEKRVINNKRWEDNNLLNLQEATPTIHKGKSLLTKSDSIQAINFKSFEKDAKLIFNIISDLNNIIYSSGMPKFYKTNIDYIESINSLKSLYETLRRKGTVPLKEGVPYEGQIIYIKCDVIEGRPWIKNNYNSNRININYICVYHNGSVFVFFKSSPMFYRTLHIMYDESGSSLKKVYSEQDINLLENVENGVKLEYIIPWGEVKEWMPTDECYSPNTQPFRAKDIQNYVVEVKKGVYDKFLNNKNKKGVYVNPVISN